MIQALKTLARKVAGVFGIEENCQNCFGSTGKEISRRGSTVIVRSYKDLMFHVVDSAAEGGPELVGEFAIYSNAVLQAELWENRRCEENAMTNKTAGRPAPQGRKIPIGIRVTPDVLAFCKQHPDGFVVLELELRSSKEFKAWLKAKQ